ncbi:UNKNOWN [Stylonychia lemnae]|uniref:Uncharacterized protein n=1 Tax=Stylonychia lemnae TaxID=5949 RepID=A0A077ZRE5_STYLE|nr:UNKNOWN [Stylonychia lemnae]|eukprot:CDW72024.1 UNKNOWN [Stylonychia lemnae]
MIGKKGGAIYLIDNQNSNAESWLQVISSNFSNIKSVEYGGAIYIQHSDFSIIDSMLSFNEAEDSGGSIYLSCLLSQNCVFKTLNNIFANNKAKIKGGSIHYDSVRPLKIEQNIYMDNQAQYGPNWSSYPFKLNIMKDIDNQLQDLASGQYINKPILFSLLDQDDQSYDLDSASTANMISDQISIGGRTKVIAQNGIFTFTDIFLQGIPKESAIIQIELSDTEYPLIEQIVNKEKSIRITSALFVQEDFIHQMLKILDAINAQVIQCAQVEISQQLILDIGEAQSIQLKYMSASMIKLAQEDMHQNVRWGIQGSFAKYARLKKMCQVLRNPKRNKPQAVLVRIITGYLQVIMLCQDMDLQWPDRVKNLLSYFSSFQSSQKNLLSFDCLMIQFGLNRNEAFYGKILTFGFLPIAFSIIAASIWLSIKFSIKKNDSDFKVIRNIKITSFAIILIVFPTVTTMSFSIFQCFQYEDNYSYLLNNMDIQCWSESHSAKGNNCFIQQTQALLGILPLVFQSYQTSKIQPYIDPRFNRLDFHATFVCTITLLGGIFFTSEEVRNNQDFLFIIFLVILIYNAAFLSYWAITMVITLVRYYANFFNRIQGYFNNKIKIDDYETNLKKYLKIYVEVPEMKQKANINSLSTPRLKTSTAKLLQSDFQAEVYFKTINSKQVLLDSKNQIDKITFLTLRNLLMIIYKYK